MIALKGMAHDILRILRRHRRALLVFYLFFTGLAVAVLIPTLTWPLSALGPITGGAAVTTGGLVHFMLTPGGWLWLLATLAITLLLTTLQQAGMIIIAAAGDGRDYRIALAALWTVIHRFPRLAGLTLVKTAAHALVALPFVVTIAVAFNTLLSPYEIAYLRMTRPPVLWWFLGITGVAGLGVLICNGHLFVRWLLATPVMILERTGPLEALRRSARLTTGERWHLSGLVGGSLLWVLGVPLLVALLFNQFGQWLVTRVPEDLTILVPAMLAYIAGSLLLTIASTFLGITGYSLILDTLYLRATGTGPRPPYETPPPHTGPWAWAAEILVIGLALMQTAGVLQTLNSEQYPTITAHRGSSLKAPENTLSAIKQAIQDGADYIEIDVQRTRDGTLVLWHDRDMRRILGMDKSMAEIGDLLLQKLDVGSWFSPDFAGEAVPTLAAAIETVRDRAHLYIELKPTPRPQALTRDVVALLREKNALSGTVIASTQRDMLRRAEELEPRLKSVLLAQFIIGPFDRRGLDAVGLWANRVTPATVASAHRNDQEIHVWTVDHADEMAVYVDMGVDNIITDRPDVLARLLAQRQSLSPTERFVVKVRSWLRF
ncbi:glycerophosphodiester phosphodiesterase family protein [Marinobacteraceae bacterium S3BR75-40.1]